MEGRFFPVRGQGAVTPCSCLASLFVDNIISTYCKDCKYFHTNGKNGKLEEQACRILFS